jgi:hypothetical protein
MSILDSRFCSRDVTAFQSKGFAQPPKPNLKSLSSSVLYLILTVEVMILQWKKRDIGALYCAEKPFTRKNEVIQRREMLLHDWYGFGLYHPDIRF